MKQSILTLIGIVSIFVSIIFCPTAFSQSYQDDFDVLKEENWVHWGKYAIWKVEDGFLKVWIDSPSPDGDTWPTIELLQFKEPSGSYEDFEFKSREPIQVQAKNPGYETFTITVKNISGKRASFGIAFGRRRSESPGAWPFFYLFLTDSIYAGSFNPWSGSVVFVPVPLQLHNPHNFDKLGSVIIWKKTDLASMEIRFNRGNFQWFADGEKRADVEDPEFTTTEILGFVIIGNGLHVGHGWVDSFKMTGPGLPVSPQTKLTTTWGTLKQLR